MWGKMPPCGRLVLGLARRFAPADGMKTRAGWMPIRPQPASLPNIMARTHPELNPIGSRYRTSTGPYAVKGKKITKTSSNRLVLRLPAGALVDGVQPDDARYARCRREDPQRHRDAIESGFRVEGRLQADGALCRQRHPDGSRHASEHRQGRDQQDPDRNALACRFGTHTEPSWGIESWMKAAFQAAVSNTRQITRASPCCA